MKFGLEAEKFIFDVESHRPSQRVFSILDALSDYDEFHPFPAGRSKPTNEFVLSMIEFGTSPSRNPLDVLEHYLFDYLMVQEIGMRNNISMVPLGSLPINYIPKMIPKYAYTIQNSIISSQKYKDWELTETCPLRIAGNCAGIHVHIEVESAREHLFLTDELVTKFNLGLMMTPLIGASSSPYFFGETTAHSMRGKKYFSELYAKFPRNGQLSPVFETSAEILAFAKSACDYWTDEGIKLGFSESEMRPSAVAKSNNWSPIRWNPRWNTIEIRCLDSDLIDMDAAKFIWIASAMRAVDIKGENLKCEIMSGKLDHRMLENAFNVIDGKIQILPTEAIQEIFNRAIMSGPNDELVYTYLLKLGSFCQERLAGKSEMKLFKRLWTAIENRHTTSDLILRNTRHASTLEMPEANDVILNAVQMQSESTTNLKSILHPNSHEEWYSQKQESPYVRTHGAH